MKDLGFHSFIHFFIHLTNTAVLTIYQAFFFLLVCSGKQDKKEAYSLGANALVIFFFLSLYQLCVQGVTLLRGCAGITDWSCFAGVWAACSPSLRAQFCLLFSQHFALESGSSLLPKIEIEQVDLFKQEWDLLFSNMAK